MLTFHKLISDDTAYRGLYEKGTIYPLRSADCDINSLVRKWGEDWEDATAQEFFDQQNWYIHGSPEFNKWCKEYGDIIGGDKSRQYYWSGRINGNGSQCWFWSTNSNRTIELTFEQFKQMYDSCESIDSHNPITKKDNTMDKPVKVTPATSTAIQLAGFANGWMWINSGKNVVHTDEEYINLDVGRKYFARNIYSSPSNCISLEEALELVSKTERPLQFFGADVTDKGDSLKIKCTTFDREYLKKVRGHLDKLQYHFGDVSVSKLAEELDTIL